MGSSSASRHSIRMKLVRQAARQAVSAAGLRAVARDIGITAPGLTNFLLGTNPRPATQEKLVTWYLRQGAQGLSVGSDLAEVALGVLLERLPESDARKHTERAVLRALLRGHQRVRIAPPAWLCED